MKHHLSSGTESHAIHKSSEHVLIKLGKHLLLSGKQNQLLQGLCYMQVIIDAVNQNILQQRGYWQKRCIPLL